MSDLQSPIPPLPPRTSGGAVLDPEDHDNNGPGINTEPVIGRGPP